MNKISKAISDFETNMPQEEMSQILGKIKDLPQGANLNDIITAFLGRGKEE